MRGLAVYEIVVFIFRAIVLKYASFSEKNPQLKQQLIHTVHLFLRYLLLHKYIESWFGRMKVN